MKRSKRKTPSVRRQFERKTLAAIKAAGATRGELARAQWLLTKGRKTASDDYCAALNKNSQEKAGIEYMLRSLRGEPPDFIIFNPRPEPAASYHG